MIQGAGTSVLWQSQLENPPCRLHRVQHGRVGACDYCINEHLKDEQVLSSELGSWPRCQLETVVAVRWEPECPAHRDMRADGRRAWRGVVFIARFGEWLWG